MGKRGIAALRSISLHRLPKLARSHVGMASHLRPGFGMYGSFAKKTATGCYSHSKQA